ncbi:hypothetical protein CDD82_826 [Ophiocordyceps australis]|uniref:Uncharacterized protein n=1 Tax=Ophiocordyceps australis TaxID=1399860 RepID=A0A2C5YLF2_9HYPO|nr:hypothetical protein CDD82_826 [Ophiocordyceps australis]
MARTKEEATGESAPRGRGRPSKDSSTPGGVKKAYVPTGRPRGRPPKPEGEAKAAKKAYVPTGRPRGRPKGSVKKEGAASTKAKTAAAPSAGGVRKRGRPRKSDANVTPAAKGKRGRPAKQVTEAQPQSDASGDDDDAMNGDVQLDADGDHEPLVDADNDLAGDVDADMDADLAPLAVESGEDE